MLFKQNRIECSLRAAIRWVRLNMGGLLRAWCTLSIAVRCSRAERSMERFISHSDIKATLQRDPSSGLLAVPLIAGGKVDWSTAVLERPRSKPWLPHLLLLFLVYKINIMGSLQGF